MDGLAELIGESPALEVVKEQIRRLVSLQQGARRLPSILIQGETGTGKGLVARLIHRVGPRAGGQFVDVNCAAIPEPLLEAELFGFERGAFTDARRAKPGLFQTAHRGTIFLDEVGLLPEPLQAKLLKVIEEQVLRRLGGTTAEPVDAWVISATNADLQSAIRERRFREDLFHRLAVLTLRLPPLRERGRDIVFLAQRFLARACSEYGLEEKTFTSEAHARLLAYSWPGNIRELFNVVERVALLGEGSLVTAAMLALPEPAVAETAPAPPATVSLQEAMREHLLATLERTQWNISQAAALLGITRNTLRARIKRLKLSPDPRRAAPRAPAAPRSAPASRPAAPPPSTAPASAIRWENRRVALVRAALVRPDADAGLSDTSRGLKMLVDKVRSFGGRIEEMSPRAIGAAFGLESAEDAARRAAHAAMAIRKAGERVHRADGTRFAVKIAIHVGHVLVGQAGPSADIDADAKRAQWSVLDAMLARANAGDVLVSASAAPFLEQRFQLARSEPTSGEPVFELVGSDRARLGPEDVTAPFVGRRHELELLRSRFESARAGQAQLVGVAGDVGIGKSRLLSELRRSLRGEPFIYLESGCSSGGAVIPYRPVREILRRACRLVDTDPPERARAKLRAALERLGVEAEGAVPHLLHVLGVNGERHDLATISPDAIQARAFEIVRRMLVAASRRGPLVVVVEDCHRIDSASEALLATLEGMADTRLLLILTHRSDYRPPWTDPSRTTRITLSPLSPQESRELLDQLLSEERGSTAAARDIIARAEGNPLFLEELARAALDPESDALSAADTLGDALLGRIDRLSERARRVVDAAAVLGPEAPRRALAEMCPDSDPLDEPLRELIGHGLVREVTIGDELVYVFAHPLVQETAYAGLPEARRQALHAEAGATLERLFEGRTHEVVEQVAYHYGAGDRAEEAVDWALLAAEKAQRGWANREALAHFEAALARLERMPDTDANRLRRIDAVVKQAEVRFALGRHAEHIHALEGIRRIVEASADPCRRAAWHYWTGFLHSLAGSRPEIAIDYCREASTIAETGGFEELGAFAECCLADVYGVAGRLGEAVAAGQRALAVFEARGNVWWACRALWILSTASLHLGSWEQALAHSRRALDHALAMDDPRLRAVGSWRLAIVHIERGDVATGLRHCEEALSKSSAPFDTAMVQIAHGYGLVKTGELGAGTAELARALAWFDRAQQGFSRTLTALRLGEGYVREGERARARALLEDVLANCRRLGYGHFEAVTERLLGECLVADDRSGAASHLEAAMRMLGAMGARNELAKTLVARAELSCLEGDRAGAREHLERALEIFETLGTLDEPPRVRARLESLTLVPSPTS